MTLACSDNVVRASRPLSQGHPARARKRDARATTVDPRMIFMV